MPKLTLARILTLVMTHQPVYTVYTDGGSRGNPGPAAFGYVIYDEQGKIVAEEGRYIGIATNNQAEYQGIVAALERLRDLNVTSPVECHLDSQLVVRQVNGLYRMKNADLKPWLEKLHQLRQELGGRIIFRDIPREENRFADRLVNQALDGFEKG